MTSSLTFTQTTKLVKNNDRDVIRYCQRDCHGQRGHVNLAIPDAEFSAVRFCGYSVRGTQYDRPS